jgi:hypothetical protein
MFIAMVEEDAAAIRQLGIPSFGMSAPALTAPELVSV